MTRLTDKEIDAAMRGYPRPVEERRDPTQILPLFIAAAVIGLLIGALSVIDPMACVVEGMK